ncbi:uncharacterized protein [Ptychodera flava]|uniref:uncharacterized protein n=1 Tax=Ptychodera flava TaxID=63121 RepID=UPI00396A4F4B
MCSNKLKKLQDNMSVLSELKELNISNNEISSLPDDICRQENLKFLDARNNSLRRLPNTFAESLANLQSLKLDGNPLQDPPLAVCLEGVDAIRKYQSRHYPSDQHSLFGSRDNNNRRQSEEKDTEDAEDSCNRSLPYGGKAYNSRRGESCFHHYVQFLRKGEKHTTQIHPDERKQVIDVSDEMKCEIAPNSVIKPCKISTEILQHTPESLRPSDGESAETESYKIGIETGCFERPPVVSMRSGQGSRRSHDRTRDTVVRSTDSNGNSVGLKSWKEGNIIKAEIPKSSVVTLVSKPKQYSFQLTNGDDLVVSCKNGDVEIDTAGMDDEDRKRAKITAQLMNVDENISVRARELVEENGGDVFALGTVLELQSDADISKPVAFELSLPSCGPLQSNLCETESLLLLKDGGDDRWHDVTDEVSDIQCKEKCLTFTTKLARGCTRFVVALADAGIDVEKTTRKATGMARKNCKMVNFLLLQNKENPKNLYVDCVVSDMRKDRLEEMKNEEYRRNSSLPFSCDIDLPEGERVYLHVGGDQFKVDKGSREYLTFYAKRRCFVLLTVSFDPSGDNDGDDHVQGYVKFTKTKNTDDDESVYCTLNFELPCPVKGKVPTSSPHPLDVAIDLIEEKLLSSDIKRFGRKLLSITDVDRIVYEDRDNTNEQIHQILQTWKKQKGNKALLIDLLSALENIGNKQLAETIQRSISADQQSRMTQTDPAEPVFNAPMNSQVQNNVHPTSHQREIKQDSQQRQQQQPTTVQPSMAFKGAKKSVKGSRRPPRGRGLPMSSAENSQNQMLMLNAFSIQGKGK